MFIVSSLILLIAGGSWFPEAQTVGLILLPFAIIEALIYFAVIWLAVSDA